MSLARSRSCQVEKYLVTNLQVVGRAEVLGPRSVIQILRVNPDLAEVLGPRSVIQILRANPDLAG